MAILTTNYIRMRRELKTFSDPSLATVETQFATFESTKAADTTKTWQVDVIAGYWDGTNNVIVAVATYPERNSNILGQVPEP